MKQNSSQTMYRKTHYLLLIVSFFNSIVFSISEPRPTAIDSRIRVMNYSPNDVFKFTGYYNYQASIEFARGEEVKHISMGDTQGWQIIPSGNLLLSSQWKTKHLLI